jgi:hypothetical protein
MLKVAELSYIMPVRRGFEPHPGYGGNDPRFAAAECRLGG